MSAPTGSRKQLAEDGVVFSGAKVHGLYTVQMSSDEVPNVNYDSDAVIEVAFDGIDYRLDSGKSGTALCVSHRPSGSWDWEFVGEAKWDMSSLRCKAIHRSIRDRLSTALREVAC